MKTKALILDRDGTLIEHVPYLNKIADIKLLPDVREALSLALNAGMLLFLHTNQSGVGRGMFSLEQVSLCNEHLLQELNLKDSLFERICVAPEHPATPSQYRKPSPEFAREIMRDYKLHPHNICYIGDRASDLATAHAAGTAACGVTTGLGDLPAELKAAGLLGDYPIFDSLLDAIRYLSAANE